LKLPMLSSFDVGYRSASVGSAALNPTKPDQDYHGKTY